jgi:hypothetical protein
MPHTNTEAQKHIWPKFHASSQKVAAPLSSSTEPDGMSPPNVVPANITPVRLPSYSPDGRAKHSFNTSRTIFRGLWS